MPMETPKYLNLVVGAFLRRGTELPHAGQTSTRYQNKYPSFNSHIQVSWQEKGGRWLMGNY